VARSLGATKGRIYHHFSSKGDLFAQVFKAGMDMNFEAMGPLTGTSPARHWCRMAADGRGACAPDDHHPRFPESRVGRRRDAPARLNDTPEQRSVYNELVEYRSAYARYFAVYIERARSEGDMHFDDLGVHRHAGDAHLDEFADLLVLAALGETDRRY
jgi:AcrR family transcriptional regulator